MIIAEKIVHQAIGDKARYPL